MDAVITRRPPPARVPRADLTAPNATITDREDVSPSVARLRIRPDDGVPAFEPGPVPGPRPRGGRAPAPAPLLHRVGPRRVRRPGVPGPARSRRRPDATALAPPRRRPGEARAPEGPLHRGRSRPATAGLRRHRHRHRAAAVDAGDAPPRDGRRTRRPSPDRDPRGRTRPRPRVAGPASRPWPPGGGSAYVPAVSRPADPANAGWTGATGRVDALLPSILAAAGAEAGRHGGVHLREPGHDRRCRGRTARLRPAGRGRPLGGLLGGDPPDAPAERRSAAHRASPAGGSGREQRGGGGEPARPGEAPSRSRRAGRRTARSASPGAPPPR